MSAILLLVASVYALPDGAKPPAMDKAQQTTMDAALGVVRRGGADADCAVREIALLGEAVLPAVVARLNEAPAGERLLLLAAIQRMPMARPLLVQARADPSPAIRAWFGAAPPRDSNDLTRLAVRYLDLLALAQEKERLQADADLKGMPDWRRRLVTPESNASTRERMADRRLADRIQALRTAAANRFARVGALALRTGSLAPSLDSPEFMAYLALLREEGGPLFYAVPALVALGEPFAPVLDPLLARDNHDPRKILRILYSVRKDRGRGLVDRFDSFRAEAQRALVALAPEDVGLLEKAALAGEGSVRSAALEALLRLDAPAGRTPAGKLLDPELYGPNEFRRAALLAARAGDLDRLAAFAEVTIPDDGSERSARLHQLQQVCASALRSAQGERATALGEKYLQSESGRLRVLGMDLLRDPQRLLERAGATEDARQATALAERALTLGGGSVAQEAIRILKRDGRRLSLSVYVELRRHGCIKELIELARGGGPDDDQRQRALDQLAHLPSIEKEHEPALLELHRKQPDRASLAALLPLDSEAVQSAFAQADPDDALQALADRAETNQGSSMRHAALAPAAVPDADPDRLELILRAASVAGAVEPGLFHALYKRWDGIPNTDRFDGSNEQKARVLKALARSRDRLSAELLLADLLARRFKNPATVLGTLHAAVRLLPPEKLRALIPVMHAAVKDEYPVKDQPALFDAFRAALLRGGTATLGYAQVPEGLPFLCDLVLDPGLQYDHESKSASAVPYWALQALRAYPAADVAGAFRAALARAPLARLHPRYFFWLVGYCHENRKQGRGLYEVSLALCEVLERLPWEGDVAYEKMRALGGLGRFKDAAASARAAAARKRDLGYSLADGFRTPEYLEARALLYDAVAARDLKGVAEKLDGDPFLLNLLAWYAHFNVPNEQIANAAAEEAVRASAGLYHAYRDTLAAVRIRQNRAREALRLLDKQGVLPDDRRATSGWYLYFQARAELLLGDEKAARQDLERALEMDRRLLPTALADKAFAPIADLFRQAEDDYLDQLFAVFWED